MSGRVGRPQGRPRGDTEQANALATFLLELTGGMTVRELAGRYHTGKTLWGEYRSGQKIIPLDLLLRLVRDSTPDEPTRELRMETAARLHTAALNPDPGPPPLPPPSPTPKPARGRLRLILTGGAVLLAGLVLLIGWGLPAGPETRTGVFATGPGGHGVYEWDGETGWGKIGDAAQRLWSGPAGLFATGTDDLLYKYGGRPGLWSLISEPGDDFAVSGSHVYRLDAGRGAVRVWDGQGTSWTRIGGPAARLYGGDPGLFAVNPDDGRIFQYLGRPGLWDVVGTVGADFALTGKHLYGLTPERTVVNRWLADQGSAWVYAAGPAADLYGGGAGLFSTDLSRRRLRVLSGPEGDGGDQNWQDIGPAGAEVRVGRQEVFVLSEDRSQIMLWTREPGTWRRIGGPAQTLTA